ncbi:putative transcriptional acitvator, Baf family [Acidimicrobium ferrooxidans DSM 10331]|uniref:Type III pantothenate kinase n=1 Tax=Acidimicrobium ferrooxidans (strain DSM 10331 / JCM 15462 / NBRC 103882 / ICP) TaxID=525909 RepID=C7M1R5_ACIFD|nr:type III pantothenate kinase [Acidimicrobium ferrooxidans]ACU54812.1 putative transcriptional acitvator, Baf family [Acidimicrobium ferrooxidans DSM 10331]
MAEHVVTIDVGNTETVIGVYDTEAAATTAEEGLVAHLRLATRADRTADETAILVETFLDRHHLVGGLVGAIVASSAANVTRSVVDMVEGHLGLRPLVVGPGTRVGIPIRYDDPREVGPDRVVDAVAAVELYGAPVLVVDFGTATTVDAIDASGAYLGGAIAPGVVVALDALVARAAALRKVELRRPKAAIGRSTVESIQSGVINGVVGQVTHLVELMRAEIGAEAPVVATGGLCEVIGCEVPVVGHIEPWLTLHGLRLVWARNQGRRARA